MITNWRGDQFAKRIVTATRAAMDETMALCVVEAKMRVRVRTTTLQGSIQMRPTRDDRGRGLVGLWGSFTVHYAIYQEFGTGIMVGQPYLRPAADHHYPLLPDRIRRHAGLS